MNDTEMEALSNILEYITDELEGHSRDVGEVEFDSIAIRDWFDYQVDMATKARVNADARRAVANAYAKERS